MNAVVYTQYGGPEVLHVADVAEPHPGPGQVRIAVRATGFNAIDFKQRSGFMKDFAPVEFPAIDGREAAGVVDEVGEGASAQPGDEVFGFTVGGAAADYAILDAFHAKPAGMSFAEAAALPIAAETSVRVFTVLGGLDEGGTLVINGAAGGVGVIGVQIARARGQRVIGTASERNHDFLRSLGAEPVAYGDGMVERIRALAPEGVSHAFDAAGRGIAELIELTGDPARVATIADFSAGKRGVKVTGGGDFRVVEALGEAAELYEAGRLRVEIEETFTFSAAAQAHILSAEGHVRGKLVLVPDAG
jgi:NADPH:quinone reductase-like Zn-dependent oxidoreductase